MLPPDLLQSNHPDVLRAGLRLVDAQLTVAMKQILSLTKLVEKLTGKDVTQSALVAINGAPVPPVPEPQTGPTPLEISAASGEAQPAAAQPEPAARRPKTGHGPKKQTRLERVERIYPLDPPDCTCPACGRTRAPMPGQYESSEMIDVVEMKVELVTVQRAKYPCTCGIAIETAEGPLRSTPGGRYSLAFAVFVAISKYLYHLPLERQVRQFKDHGLDVGSQVLWDQLVAIAKYCRPTAKAIRAAVLKLPVIGVDQTGWKDLSRPGGKWQLWGLSSETLLYYEIYADKGLGSFLDLLGTYKGVIVGDAASTHIGGVKRSPNITLAGCWAHVFRRFREAATSFPEAKAVMKLIAALYEVDAKAENPAARGESRKSESRAIIDKLRTWLEARRLIPKQTTLGGAIQYTLNAWPQLTVFLENAAVWLDNNRTERQLRGPVVGRKNHYGSKTKLGTEIAALFYTLIESAKLAGVSPRGYLNALVEAAAREPNREIVLLPADYAATLPKELA